MHEHPSHHDPQPWSRHALEHGGFVGFVPFAALDPESVPAAPGVYAVLRPTAEAPAFTPDSPAAPVRGRAAAVAVDVLARRWVEGPEVLYIGKATPGAAGRRGLRKRLEDYRRSGAGQPVAHWAGRYVWQLEDRDRLLVAWNATHEDAATVESRMLTDFVDRYGALPFANLRR